jgi:hypothetical protein
MGRSGVRGAVAATAGRVPATLVFLGVTVAVASWLESLPTEAREDQILAASTNLHNLLRGDLLTFATSAFVHDDVTVSSLAVLAAVLGTAELRWGSRRLLGAFAAGHVGATVLVAAGLVAGGHLGWVPSSWFTSPDVGVSYGIVCIAGALTADVPRRLRAAWGLCWLVPLAADLVGGATYTDAGHVCALLIGFGLATARLRRRASGQVRLDSVPVGCEAAAHEHEGTGHRRPAAERAASGRPRTPSSA